MCPGVMARSPPAPLQAGTDGFALIPNSPRERDVALVKQWPPGLECSESIAEHNFNRKKMLTIEDGIHKLQRNARQQHEVVSQIESGMKSMISETDLRRVIGLAFQEFEQRLEDAFQDSNRKCLAMFSRRDEVTELEQLLNKKVNWVEYNTVLKKLADLRNYLDTMAEDIFIGHREALNGEFAKKADKVMVEDALKLKADWDEVNEVRARLERLEVLVSHTDKRQTKALDALREETITERRAMTEQHRALISENTAAIAAFRVDHEAVVERLVSAECEVKVLKSATESLRDVQQSLLNRTEQVIMPTIASMQEQLSEVELAAERTRNGLQVLADDCNGFQDTSKTKFADLFAQAQHCKEQLEFLMQATEMIKRRSRETTKSTDARFKEGSDDQEQLAQQVAALEKQMKRFEREMRQFERTAGRAENLATMLPLPPPEPAVPADPSNRLKGVLDQLEKIASSGPQHERLGIEWNPKRPPLPLGGSDVTQRGLDGDPVKLQLPGVDTTDVTRIDSARGLPGTGKVHAAYSLSPRPGPQGSKTPRRKR